MHNSESQPVVVVVDSDKDRGRGMVQSFLPHNCLCLHLWKDGIGKMRISGADTVPEKCNILLWHVGDLAGTWADIPADVLIYYSGNGGYDSRFPPNTSERIWRAVRIGPVTAVSGVLSVEEACTLLNYVGNEASENGKIPKPAFLAGTLINLSTLALLCQAYLAVLDMGLGGAQEQVKAVRTNIPKTEQFDCVAKREIEQTRPRADLRDGAAKIQTSSWWLEALDVLSPDTKDAPRMLEEFQEGVINECRSIPFAPPSEPTLEVSLSNLFAMLEECFRKEVKDSGNQQIMQEVVAAAYKPLSRSLDIQVEQLTSNEETTTFEKILGLKGNSTSTAAMAVVSLLLGVDQMLLVPTALPKPLKLPKQSLIILTEDQLTALPRLRAYGFSGAVLVLSTDSFSKLKEKHRILLWGQGSHDACVAPFTLNALLNKVVTLVPLEQENLKLLQNELKATNQLLPRRYLPHLDRLRKPNRDFQREMDSIASVINELRALTPITCHTLVEIDGYRAQIQQHFQRLMQKIQSSHGDDRQAIAHLRQVFDQWRNHVLEIGEESSILTEVRNG